MNLDGKACMYFIVFVHIKYDQIKILLFFENDLLSSAIIAIFFEIKDFIIENIVLFINTLNKVFTN